MSVDLLLAEIKIAMTLQGLTVRAMAEALDKSEQSVGSWFAGKYKPTIEHLDALARVVGLEVALRKIKDEAPARSVQG